MCGCVCTRMYAYLSTSFLIKYTCHIIPFPFPHRMPYESHHSIRNVSSRRQRNNRASPPLPISNRSSNVKFVIVVGGVVFCSIYFWLPKTMMRAGAAKPFDGKWKIPRTQPLLHFAYLRAVPSFAIRLDIPDANRIKLYVNEMSVTEMATACNKSAEHSDAPNPKPQTHVRLQIYTCGYVHP